jgi:hypothetical protein
LVFLSWHHLAMKETLDRLEHVLARTPSALRALGESASRERPAAEKWSRKQILGHLIDSASNNHQRFVRAQLVEALSFPPYAQEGWVAVQAYDDEPWDDLIELWTAYNRHLLHVMARVPPDKHGRPCQVGPDEPMNLGDLMRDYVRHLEHHLGQILGAEAR